MKIAILGATGSIGESARKVARDIPERMEIVGMSAHSNLGKLQEAAKDFPKAKLAVSSASDDDLVRVASRAGESAQQSHRHPYRSFLRSVSGRSRAVAAGARHNGPGLQDARPDLTTR